DVGHGILAQQHAADRALLGEEVVGRGPLRGSRLGDRMLVACESEMGYRHPLSLSGSCRLTDAVRVVRGMREPRRGRGADALRLSKEIPLADDIHPPFRIGPPRHMPCCYTLRRTEQAGQPRLWITLWMECGK